MQCLDRVKKVKVVAILVAYNPDMQLLSHNLELVKEQVDEIIIVNNSDDELILENKLKITIINNYENLGIAKALNIGLSYAIKNNYDFALMLDQDSTPAKDMLEYELKAFNSTNIAMVVPRIVYLNANNNENYTSEVEDIKFAITSGSLIRVSYIKNIGYLDEKLFIDSVDFDYCYKIRLSNYKIIKANRAILYQRLGELTMHKLWIFTFYPTNHNYIRRYYITRNRLYMWSRYWSTDKKFVIKSFLRNLQELMLIILFESDKSRKLKYAAKGAIDFLRGKGGRLT